MGPSGLETGSRKAGKGRRTVRSSSCWDRDDLLLSAYLDSSAVLSDIASSIWSRGESLRVRFSNGGIPSRWCTHRTLSFPLGPFFRIYGTGLTFCAVPSKPAEPCVQGKKNGEEGKPGQSSQGGERPEPSRTPAVESAPNHDCPHEDRWNSNERHGHHFSNLLLVLFRSRLGLFISRSPHYRGY